MNKEEKHKRYESRLLSSEQRYQKSKKWGCILGWLFGVTYLVPYAILTDRTPPSGLALMSFIFFIGAYGSHVRLQQIQIVKDYRRE